MQYVGKFHVCLMQKSSEVNTCKYGFLDASFPSWGPLWVHWLCSRCKLHPQDLPLSHLTMMLLSLEGNVTVTVQVQSCCAKCCQTHMWTCLICGLCLTVEVAVLLQHVICTRTWFLVSEFHFLSLISSRMKKTKDIVDI